MAANTTKQTHKWHRYFNVETLKIKVETTSYPDQRNCYIS